MSYYTRRQRKYEASEIRYKLETDDYWLCRGLMAVYKFHKYDVTQPSTHRTGVSFTPLDARDLIPLAELCLQGQVLTPLQIRVARPKMLKYADRLAAIANGIVKLPKSNK